MSAMSTVPDDDALAYFHRTAPKIEEPPINREEAERKLAAIATELGCAINGFSWMNGVHCVRAYLRTKDDRTLRVQFVFQEMTMRPSTFPPRSSRIPILDGESCSDLPIDVDATTFGDVEAELRRLIKNDFGVSARH